MQDSNDTPNKLSCRTATIEVNRGRVSVLPATHTRSILLSCTPQSQGNRPSTGTKLCCLVTEAHRCK